MKKKKSPAPVKKRVPAKRKAPAFTSSAGVKNASVNLSQQLKAEILNVYNEGWEAYVKGDLKTHGFHLSNNFNIIGSSEAEQFNSKKSWLAYCKKTIKQFAGVIQLKNRKIKLVPAGEEVMVVENADIYALIDKKWSFYSRIRITALLQKEKTGWKYVHQHGSLPDARAKEGEVIATAKIKKENLQLRDAVKRRTVELEQKNRELEIEAAMEKVRVRSLAMQKPEELAEVAEVLRNEMDALGVEELETSSIYIVDETQGTTECWYAIKDIRAKDRKLVTDHMTIRLHETWVGKQMQKFHRSKQTRTSILMQGENRKEWINYCAAKSSVLKGYYGGEIPERTYHLLKFSNGFIGAASPGAISIESWDLLQRATAVFSFAYQRFSDLQKADAQSRKAQIELALEKIRSRSLAMHQSREIQEIVNLLFSQLKVLQVQMASATLIIVNDENEVSQYWIASDGFEYAIQLNVPRLKGVMAEDFHKAWKEKMDFSRAYSLEEKNEYLTQLFENSDFKLLPPERKDFLLKTKVYNLAFAFTKSGCLTLTRFDEAPYSASDLKILSQIAKVFDQAYTRFLDLQKAEAQAREAQIEASLERVRAKTMAMHNSEDVSTAIATLFTELDRQSIENVRCGIAIIDINKTMEVWSVTNVDEGKMVKAAGRLDMNAHTLWQLMYDDWKNKNEFLHYHLSGEEKQTYINILNSAPGYLSQPLLELPDMHCQVYYFNEGAIWAYSLQPHTDQQQLVMKRFTSVFSQTYLRYRDLQKAEAQARESQIQLALERVRARTMAMQHSGELREIAAAVHDQLLGLGFTSGFCSIVIMDRISGDMTWWMFFPGKEYPESYHMPFCEHPFYLAQLNNWKQGEKYSVIEVSGEEKKAYDKYTFSQTEFAKIPIGTQQFMMSFEKITFSNAYMKHGAFSWGVEPIDDEHAAVLQRFASVFEQCYTRFLDLQKAEGQAREAQIEAALERVRSKTMAMHKSEQLPETAQVLFEQFAVLGKIPDRIAIGIIKEELQLIEWWATDQTGSQLASHFNASILKPTIAEYFVAWKEGKDSTIVDLSGDALNEWIAYVRDEVKMPIDDSKMKGRRVHHAAFFAQGLLLISAHEPMPDETMQLLVRFAKVFNQTYTRFLDLQKAEAQAREAQIETGLERVRSRSLAMHNTFELQEVIHTVHKELLNLSIAINGGSFIAINSDIEKALRCWGSGGTADTSEEVHLPLYEKPFCTNLINGIKSGPSFFTEEYTQKEKVEFFTFLLKHEPWSKLDAVQKKEILSSPGGYTRSCCVSQHTSIFIINHFGEKFSVADNDILKRFAKVFEQTYTRFLDLRKAEAQAREAQIEAALERVRSRSLAMHKSEEVEDVILVVSEQLQQLQFKFNNVSFGFDTEQMGLNFWLASPQLSRPFLIKVPYIDNPAFNRPIQSRKNGADFCSDILTREENLQFLQHMFDFSDLNHIPTESKSFLLSTPGFARSQSLMKNTILTVGNYFPTPYSQEQNAILKRFGNVFEQAYVRFLDLQKAEAQAREAQIEAALERVRSKTMAMHNSQDVGESVATLFDELVKLGVKTNRCGILIYNDPQFAEVWTAKSNANEKATLIIGKLEISMHPMLVGARASWANKEPFFSYELKDQDMINYYHSINKSKYYPTQFNLEALPVKEIHSEFYFSEGSLFAFTNEALPTESAAIFKRFTSVFGQTYRRYLDLQKAEAQAREATIEASLERVRGKAMAMHNSNDVSSTASMVFTELRKLGISPIRCGVGLLNKESRRSQLYSAVPSTEGDSLSLVGWVLLTGHSVMENIYDHWQAGTDYFPVLTGEELNSYYAQLLSGFSVPNIPPADQKQFGHFLSISIGCLYAWAEAPYNKHEIKILKRFASIIDLTFRRYIELQKSEANALETVRSASLDRVRAEIASMRTKQDLERITPLIWKELTTLGIPFVRCGVFIMDEQEELIHTFLSTPDGKAIAAFHVPYGSTPLAGSIEFWREKKMYLTHWGIKEYAEFADAFIHKNETEKRAHYLSSVPTDGIHLHLLPFMQGMLYVGNNAPLQEDNFHLIQSVADAFSTAYARYEDFNKIESAKAQVEKTLSDLKQTQAQLVQSEKMASLGELTAGIAHEIQNPLNFVNNFSEVSSELVDEMKTELATGNVQLATEISNDLKQNLEKINHHGKRAADIVKGMLQHSRSSSGVKEPTDINALADEYLRLAYHGLRAKDKSFNATMHTDFDQTIGNINIIPQDMGRVILNLITNAFYVVNEKSRQGIAGYEPTVSVSTKKDGNKVLISMKDNGNGIPENIKEKIFQPFFTTKPTGQGTGLGLSLSYDIVKAHGGELKVETKDREGSEFIILLPIS